MAASLHLARYSGRDAARLARALRRTQRELDRLPGLAAGHVFATIDLTTRSGGWPTPARWALFCGWNDDKALEQFERSAVLEDFLTRARETWRMRLEPVRVVNGSWRGWRPETDGVDPRKDEPIAVITYGRLRARYVPVFLWNNRKAVIHADRSPGLLARIGLADTVRTASTFSLWRSQGDAVRFAYGPGDHKPVVSRSKAAPWADDYFFARFRLLQWSGTWNGRDPLAEAGLRETTASPPPSTAPPAEEAAPDLPTADAP
jgi:hypothetical protein